MTLKGFREDLLEMVDNGWIETLDHGYTISSSGEPAALVKLNKDTHSHLLDLDCGLPHSASKGKPIPAIYHITYDQV